MFTRYNINDLFLAHVVITSEDKKYSYGYLTVLKKNANDYTDLQNLSRTITKDMIYKIEALSNHYSLDNKVKNLSRKKAVSTGKQHYEALRPKNKAI